MRRQFHAGNEGAAITTVVLQFVRIDPEAMRLGWW
jgi:hypothetical protein